MPVAAKPGLANGLPDGDEAPLRAGTVNGQLREPRLSARVDSAIAISDASEGISLGRLGEHFGGDLGGAKLKTGAMVATPGEVALLAPPGVATKTFVWLLRMRYARLIERHESTDKLRFKLGLALSHLDALLVCTSDADAEEMRGRELAKAG